MVRNTLAWEACDLCGRRAPTVDCMIGGTRMKLCPYCAIALSSKSGVTCKGLTLLIPSIHITSLAEEKLKILEARVKVRVKQVQKKPSTRASKVSRRRSRRKTK